MSDQDKILFAFDWNGTLLDDLPAVVTAFRGVQEKHGHKPCDVVEFQEWFDFPLDRLYRNAGFRENLIQNDLYSLQKLWVEIYEPLEEKASLRAGAVHLLKEVMSAQSVCTIFSNHFVGRIQVQCSRLRIKHHFDEILASAGVKEQVAAPSKKDRLRQYMAACGIAPERTFVIGDTPEEIHIAHEFGAIGIAITGGFASQKRLEACQPNYLVHSLTEIPVIARKVFPNWGSR